VIDLSLNEVETTGAKAARGAGFSWGLAEEIGRAARRVALFSGEWGPALVALLRHAPDFDPPDPARVQRWRRGLTDRSASRPLCPVRTAALLLDDPGLSVLPPATIVHVGLPVWLQAKLGSTNLAASYEGGPIVPAADVIGLYFILALEASGRRRGAVDPDTLAALNLYAARTYVPESERSRRRGAGGGRVGGE